MQMWNMVVYVVKQGFSVYSFNTTDVGKCPHNDDDYGFRPRGNFSRSYEYSYSGPKQIIPWVFIVGNGQKKRMVVLEENE